jgi:hypothetical protein
MMRLERNTWLNVFVVFLATVGGSVVGFWYVLLTFGPAVPLQTLHAMSTETTGAGTASTDRQPRISR